jgi:hypothetical protein
MNLGMISLTPPFRGVSDGRPELETVLTVYPSPVVRGGKPLKRLRSDRARFPTLLKQGVNEMSRTPRSMPWLWPFRNSEFVRSPHPPALSPLQFSNSLSSVHQHFSGYGDVRIHRARVADTMIK